MMFYSISQLVVSFIICQLHLPLALAENDVTTLAAPIVAVPSEVWEGNDGTWSTFEIRVGTPPQVARVLPATSWQETWVIWKEAELCNTTLGVPSDCGNERGMAFDNDSSSTFEIIGQFGLILNEDLGYSGEAQYGFDTVGLGFTNTTGPTLAHQIVAAFRSGTWWFGILGIGFQPTNFTSFGDPQDSFADTLSSNGTISSMSWSYTAGAVYRLKSVFGSLIFGGYDASRFTPNNMTFDMTNDNERDIVLSLQSITSTTSSGNTTLMSASELMFIDSSVPEIWLPVDVCEEFEKAFGLEIDTATDRYLLNASTQSSLAALNPTFTFTLANDQLAPDAINPTNTINITLPYDSFNLNVSEPIVANTTSFYFPIRRAVNSSQCTIGRIFLQEAYVTADYNSRTFNVSQCVFENNAAADVIAIPSVLPTSTGTAKSTSSPSHKSLSDGAIAGIVVGAVLVLLLLACLIFSLRRRHHQKLREKDPSNNISIGSPTPIHEIDPGTRVVRNSEGQMSNMTAYNEQASKLTSELHGQDAMVEISGRPIMHPQEMEADLVPGIYFEAARKGEGDAESEKGDIDADNPESSGLSGAEGDVSSGGGGIVGGVRRKATGKGESSGEESGTTGVSSLSPFSSSTNRGSLSPRGGLTPAPTRNRNPPQSIHNFSRPAQRAMGIDTRTPGNLSPDVSTDSEGSPGGRGNRASGSEGSTDHLVSPMTDRGSVMGRGRPGTWNSTADGSQGLNVSSPVSEES